MKLEQFKKWINKNQVEMRTLEGFWKNYESYKVEEPKDYFNAFGHLDKSDLIVKIDRISLNLHNWPACSNNTVSAHIPIQSNHKEMGYYELIFSFSGDVVDDYFVIY